MHLPDCTVRFLGKDQRDGERGVILEINGVEKFLRYKEEHTHGTITFYILRVGGQPTFKIDDADAPVLSEESYINPDQAVTPLQIIQLAIQNLFFYPQQYDLASTIEKITRQAKILTQEMPDITALINQHLDLIGQELDSKRYVAAIKETQKLGHSFTQPAPPPPPAPGNE